MTDQSRVRTLYVSRKVINGQEILDWAARAGIPSEMVAADLHVTICFSKTALDWDSVTPNEDQVEATSFGDRTLERFGDALVLRVPNDTLASRHQYFRAAGASSDFPEYKPHVTLSYNASDVELSTIEPFTGDIRFGPELFAEAPEDWRPAASSKNTSTLAALIPRGLAPSGARGQGRMQIGLAEAQMMKVSPMSARAMQVLANLFKSMPASDLKDLEQIADYTDDKNKVPSAEENGMQSGVIEARGSAAQTESDKHTVAAQQAGITKQYQELVGRFGKMEKSVQLLVDGLRKAVEDDTKDPDEENPFEKAEKAVRKSRVAVAKAKDEEDMEDCEDAMEKAERALAAARDAVSKAEDKAASDDDEDRMTKARKALRTVKADLVTLRADVATRKAAAVAPVAATTVTDAAVKAEPTIADVVKSQETLTEQLGVVTKSLGEVMAQIAGGAAPAVRLQPAPSTVVKSATPEALTLIEQRIEDEGDLGNIPVGTLMKANSLAAHLRAVQAGNATRESFDAAMERADPDAQKFFINQAA